MGFCALTDPLYAALIGYKESPIVQTRLKAGALLIDHVARFFAAHHACLEDLLGGGPDVVVLVPSTHRPDGAPLAHLTKLASTVTHSFETAPALADLLRRGAAPLGHMQPHPDGFVVPELARPLVRGGRVLLCDDTYVSGARAQSAAAALRSGGVRTVVITPLARLLRPDRLPSHATYMAKALPRESCCVRCGFAQAVAGTE
jgi:hypothetical protein